MAFPIKIDIDLPAPLVHTKDRGFAYSHRFSGPDSDYTLSNIWRDPARQTVMLQPWQLTAAFKTTNTGLLRRLTLPEFWTDSSAVSTNWEPSAAFGVTGDTFLVAKTTGERLTTMRKWAPNQAFFLRTFAYGGYGDKGTMVQLEWGIPSVASSAPQYQMLLAFDGSFVLNKRDATTQALKSCFTGYIVPETKDRTDLHQRYFELMILPFRRNEILFWSSLGAYPVWTDTTRDALDHLVINPLKPNGGRYRGSGSGAAAGYGDIKDTDWVITEYGHFSVKYPTGKGYFQLTPVVFLSDSAGRGKIAPSIPLKLPYAPNAANWPSGAATEVSADCDVFSDSTGSPAGDSEVVVTDNLSPDGTHNTMPWSVAVRGHRPDPQGFPTQCSSSPFVYGFDVVYPPGTQTTNDTPTSIEGYIKSLTRSYTEDGSSCTLEFKNPRTISEQYMQALHRYCRIYWVDGLANENELFYGIATEPDFDQWAISPDGIDHTPVTFMVRDPWWDFETTQIVNVRALDGLTIQAAVNVILDLMGWPSDRRDIDDLRNFILPNDQTNDEKLLLSEQICNAKELLLHLRDNYTSANNPPYRWRMDFAPVLKSGIWKICFRFKNPDTEQDVVSGGQSRTLYATQAAAIAAGKTKDDWARTFRRRVMEPEANYVSVWGIDPNGTPINRVREDQASQNPTLAFGARPLNWIGRRREVVYRNDAFISPNYVNKACSALFNRVSTARILAEVTAEHATDDRLGEVIKLDWENRRYFLTELRVQHVLETDAKTNRIASYVLEAKS